MSADFEAFDRLVAARLDRWTQELVEFLAVSSEGGDLPGLHAAADWTANRLRSLGATVDVVEVAGKPPLYLRTMIQDAHSSLSVVLPNAGHRLVAALATFWDADGRPAIAGLDAGKRAPTPVQLETIATMSTQDIEDIHAEWGVERFIGGLDGVPALEALTFGTTLNLQGLWAGHTEATPKTVTPAEAHARLDIRIVPDQRPADMVDAVRRHLDGRGFADIEIRTRESEPAWWTPPDHPVVQAAARVSGAMTGLEASIGVSGAGTVPMWQVCGRDRVPSTSLGAARADCRAHAPDENIRIDDLALATRITGRFYEAFAALPEVPKVV